MSQVNHHVSQPSAEGRTGCGCLIVSVDYRLAQETRFLDSREDNYAPLRWLNANADLLGVDRKRIASVEKARAVAILRH
jgi:acetyl esterase/lipase